MDSYLIKDKYGEIRNVINIDKEKMIKPYNQIGKRSVDIEFPIKSEKKLNVLLDKYRSEFLFTEEELEINIIKSTLSTGQYYERIYRPIQRIDQIPFLLPYIKDKPKIEFPIEPRIYFDSLNQISYVTDLLLTISRVVHFNESNLAVYGNEIRNLIILTCTEIEAQWKGILTSNNYNLTAKFYTTKDYVKLLSVLKLNQYELKFRNFPELSPFKPFDNWNSSNPTKSLSWYNDYNKIKHDRENDINLASVENLINCISALVIMLVAQFGFSILHEDGLKKYFILNKYPSWAEDEKYLPPESLENCDWKNVELEIK